MPYVIEVANRTMHPCVGLGWPPGLASCAKVVPAYEYGGRLKQGSARLGTYPSSARKTIRCTSFANGP